MTYLYIIIVVYIVLVPYNLTLFIPFPIAAVHFIIEISLGGTKRLIFHWKGGKSTQYSGSTTQIHGLKEMINEHQEQ